MKSHITKVNEILRKYPIKSVTLSETDKGVNISGNLYSGTSKRIANVEHLQGDTLSSTEILNEKLYSNLMMELETLVDEKGEPVKEEHFIGILIEEALANLPTKKTCLTNVVVKLFDSDHYEVMPGKYKSSKHKSMLEDEYGDNLEEIINERYLPVPKPISRDKFLAKVWSANNGLLRIDCSQREQETGDKMVREKKLYILNDKYMAP